VGFFFDLFFFLWGGKKKKKKQLVKMPLANSDSPIARKFPKVCGLYFNHFPIGKNRDIC